MEPFTVLIPTLDRCETLADTLESCLVQTDDAFRVIVSDNHSTDATRDLVAAYQRRDPRISCIRPARRMGMATHYEFALDHVPEGYVMILGSDDALLPGAMTRARAHLAEYPGIAALHGVWCGQYYYPHFPPDQAGRLHLRLTPRHELRTASEWLAKAGRSDCSVAELPMVYGRAFVRTSVLQALAAGTGRRIHSAIPDYYLAAATGSMVQQYLHVNPGYAISGQSLKSTGISQLQPAADRAVWEAFGKENEIPFHPEVRYARSTDVIIGEVLLRAKEAGLLPAEFPIFWDRMIARAFLEVQALPWSQAERASHEAELRALSQRMGCPQLLEKVDTYPSVGAWAAALPFTLGWEDTEWDWIADTRPLGIRGVHEAARFAEALLQTAAQGATVSGDFAKTPPSDWIAWATHQLAHQGAALRHDLREAHATSNRRAVERDNAKAKLAGARNKVEQLQAKLEEAQQKVRRKWWQ